MSRAPLQLLEQDDLTSSERALLEAGRTQPAVEYDVAAGEARLRAGLAALAAGAAVAAHATNGSGLAAKTLLAKISAKLLLGAVGAMLLVEVGVAARALVAQRSPAVTPAQFIVTTESSRAVAGAVVGGAQPASVASAPEAPLTATPTGATDGEGRKSRHPAAATARTAGSSARSAAAATPGAGSTAEPSVQEAEPRRPPGGDQLGELRAVAVARTLLDRDPKAALGVLDGLRRDYPSGYFVEEREALIVLALDRARQSSAARQEAAVFLRRFPNGPFSDRVRAVLSPSN